MPFGSIAPKLRVCARTRLFRGGSLGIDFRLTLKSSEIDVAMLGVSLALLFIAAYFVVQLWVYR